MLVDALRDEMFDLEPRVDLHEVEAARSGVAEELDGGCALVVALLRESESPGVETRSFFVGEIELQVREKEKRRNARRLFDELLVAALERTLALAELDDVAVRIAEDLDLDVSCAREESGEKEKRGKGYFSRRRWPSPKCFSASLRQLEMISAS